MEIPDQEQGTSGTQEVDSAHEQSMRLLESHSWFDLLFERHVPHVLEKIFLYLDFKSYKGPYTHNIHNFFTTRHILAVWFIRNTL